MVCGEPTATGNINVFVLNFGEETGITNTYYSNYTNADVWYTIDGCRLSGKPVRKGVYLNNGKKVVVK